MNGSYAANDPPQDSPPKRGDLLVYVCNAVEDEWSFIKTIVDPLKRFAYITDCESVTDAYFMSLASEREFVYISPKPISAEFQAYVQSILRHKSAEVIVPTMRTRLLCEDFVADSKAFTTLVSKARNYQRVVLTSYVASYEFYALKTALEKVGLQVSIPEAPEPEAAWTVGFFGSKSGIRQLAQKSRVREPDFVMAEGLICVGREDAAKIAASIYVKQGGVVIKTNKGSGGSGILILRPGDLPANYRSCEKMILERMNGDRYWDEYPIIIEELIKINYGMAASLPSIEFKINEKGRVEMLYTCACFVTPGGKFYGVDFHQNLIHDRLQTKIEDVGYFIAEQLAAAGYRGHFDLDMAVGRNGALYVCEANTRNTGGTETFKIARKLYGKDFMNTVYILARSRSDWLQPNRYTFQDMRETLAPILLSPRSKYGVILESQSCIADGKLMYIIFAASKRAAYAFEEQMIDLLAELEFVGKDFRRPLARVDLADIPN